MRRSIAILLIFCPFVHRAIAQPAPTDRPGSLAPTTSISVNQAIFPPNAPKIAVVSSDTAFGNTQFSLVDSAGWTVFNGTLNAPESINEWAPGLFFYPANFSSFSKPGRYRLHVGPPDTVVDQGRVLHLRGFASEPFDIGDADWARPMVASIIHYYHEQRANTPPEMKADSQLRLYGSDRRVDLHGGWCDASGDVSKYFSHLAYANFMSPQQIPLVTWSLINAGENLHQQLASWNLTDSLNAEALWGADYITRSLDPAGYFYMTVFSYFNKDPDARRVVGLHANSVTTDEYQCAFREGGGMAIAALARISRWGKSGDYTPKQYLDAARRGYAHLVVNNTKYDDDGKENIIDDYCALMAATELWIATDSSYYRDQARIRAKHLNARMSAAGYFISDNGRRPFWHASDAGLPIVALIRYLDKESDQKFRAAAVASIEKALAYNLRVTNEIDNPFGYARQTFLYKDSVKDGFFIPHDNETGWWWQGENARLGSLATAALLGNKLLNSKGYTTYPPLTRDNRPIPPNLALFAAQQYSWILGCNPYNICFMYQFGAHNVPYMHSNYGHGSQRGGISNGITGAKDHGDGSGIDFRTEDNGNEWRWTEQWLPHAAWFLQALTAMNAAQPPSTASTKP
jgi:Glycosyl hydrolase family 9/Cellulase N-terminal ig-like domain